MDVTVRDNADERRFELLLDGEVAGHAAYRVRDGITVITHSEVDPARRGQGMGNDLARHTLDTLRAQHARIIPSCPFFAHYVAEHPEYADLVEN
jgi:hypothetical protein